MKHNNVEGKMCKKHPLAICLLNCMENRRHAFLSSDRGTLERRKYCRRFQQCLHKTLDTEESIRNVLTMFSPMVMIHPSNIPGVKVI